jgi:hypothetical protein
MGNVHNQYLVESGLQWGCYKWSDSCLLPLNIINAIIGNEESFLDNKMY